MINGFKKTVLITGATDGIGLETAKMFANGGHHILLHGRSIKKLEDTKNILLEINPSVNLEIFMTDLSMPHDVVNMANLILTDIKWLDVIINNAGVFVVKDRETINKDNLDIRFAVNTVAPYILTKKLLPILDSTSRVINLASAAQAPLDFDALDGKKKLSHDEAYAQSKLALIMWSMEMALDNKHGHGHIPTIIAVNPKSFLGSKMVATAYGKKGYDLKIGADILYKAALSEEFNNAGGKYFDNDIGKFAAPHPYALNKEHRQRLINFMDKFL